MTFNRNEITIMAVETSDSVTIIKEDVDGNFIVKQNGEIIEHCFSLKQALNVASMLLKRFDVDANA